MPEPLRGVTAETYARVGSAFIKVQGHAFTVARESTVVKGERIEGDPKRWGAWKAYFARKKIKALIMDRLGYYTVPAEWPYQFDSEADMLGDLEAGQNFERDFHHRQSRERPVFNKVDRAAHAAAMKSKIPYESPRDRMRVRDPLSTPTIDEEALFAAYDEDVKAGCA